MIDTETKVNYVKETRSKNFKDSSKLEGLNTKPYQYTIEDDRYNTMKNAYKTGQDDARDLEGTGVTADEMAATYTDDPELIQQYVNGWRYIEYLAGEEGAE